MSAATAASFTAIENAFRYVPRGIQIVTLTGPPVVGKTTRALIATHAARDFGVHMFDIGSRIRDHVKNTASIIGQKLSDHMPDQAAGNLQPNDLIAEMLFHDLPTFKWPKNKKGCLLIVGLPRNSEQARWIIELNRPVTVIHLDASSETSERLIDLRRSEGRSDDDNLATRMAKFKNEALPALIMIKKHGAKDFITLKSKGLGGIRSDVIGILRQMNCISNAMHWQEVMGNLTKANHPAGSLILPIIAQDNQTERLCLHEVTSLRPEQQLPRAA